MWKREKVGSTCRLGPDNVLPSVIIEGESLTKIVNKLMSQNNDRSFIDTTILNWLLDKSFKISSQTDQTHLFSLKEIDTETQLKNKTSHLRTMKIGTVASLYEQDHLPTKSLKSMLKDLSQFWNNHNLKNGNFDNILAVRKDSDKDRISELLKMDVVFPYELTKSLLTLYYNQKNGQLFTNYYCISPNISYDIYPIKPNNFSTQGLKSLVSETKLQSMSKSNPGFKSGFLILNKSNLVVPIDLNDINLSGDIRPIGKINYKNNLAWSNWNLLNEFQCISIGVWISDLPNFDDESKIKSNPYVWAACTRFVLTKSTFFKTLSPSSDKNTFLLYLFDSSNIDNSVEYYEFKIVQNNPNHKTKAHNSWVIIESEKVLEEDENKQFENLLKCPSIFK